MERKENKSLKEALERLYERNMSAESYINKPEEKLETLKTTIPSQKAQNDQLSTSKKSRWWQDVMG